MIEPLNPKVELFRWGPVPFKFFYGSDFCMAIMREFPQEFPGSHWPKTLILKKGGRFIWINELPELEEAGGVVFKKYLLDKTVKTQIKSSWQESKDSLIKIENKISATNVPLLTNEGLFVLWEELHKGIRDFWAQSTIPEFGNYGAEKLLRDKLRSQVPEDTMTELMETLSAPVEKSFFQEEEIDLAETVDVVSHQQNYFWLRNSYANVEVLAASFFEERKKELTSNLRAEVERKLKEARERKKEVTNTFGLD